MWFTFPLSLRVASPRFLFCYPGHCREASMHGNKVCRNHPPQTRKHQHQISIETWIALTHFQKKEFMQRPCLPSSHSVGTPACMSSTNWDLVLWAFDKINDLCATVNSLGASWDGRLALLKRVSRVECPLVKLVTSGPTLQSHHNRCGSCRCHQRACAAPPPCGDDRGPKLPRRGSGADSHGPLFSQVGGPPR